MLTPAIHALTTLPDVRRWEPPTWMRNLNRALGKMHAPLVVLKRFDHREDMVSLEQIANFQLLITELLEHEVTGDFVELGCYTGSTATVFARLLKDQEGTRAFHVYDSFDNELGSVRGIRQRFEERMRAAEVPLPIIHTGDIRGTVPAELPERIAFAHIDLGTGGDPALHRQLMGHALHSVYDRLVPEGVLCLMDYHVPGGTLNGNDSNPGVRLAADAFFRDKPEMIRPLYGGPCSHAYVRKR